MRKRTTHPWIFSNQLLKTFGDFEDGDVVDIVAPDNSYIGRGYINRKSKIAVRLISLEPRNVKQLIKDRIHDAVCRRANFLKSEDACRLIYSEADWLPGLIVDKYGQYLVIQINTLGMEKLKPVVLQTLIKEIEPAGIYEKSDSSSRKKEGLEKVCEWVYKSGPELIPYEVNQMKFLADTKGQKTGAFLDQRMNALLLKDFAAEKVCLDAFSYTGNFALHLLRFGAKHVTLMDYSERSLQVASEILRINGFEKRFETVKANVFDELRNYESKNRTFDLVVLDPPSFAKSRSSISSAARGHKEVNLRAMRLLRKPGILVSASCTQVLFRQDFEKILLKAAEDNHVELAVLQEGCQPPDHPVILSIPETRYLKFIIAEVRRRY